MRKRISFLILFLAGCSCPPRFRIGDCVAIQTQKEFEAGRVVDVDDDFISLQGNDGYHHGGPEALFHHVPADWCE